MIEAEGLVKSFGGRKVLRGIDLRVKEGECVAVIGPNGAGKTTLIKVLTTLSRPLAGNVRLVGMDIRKEAVAIRRKSGIVSHHTFLYDHLTAHENLKFYGKMYDVPDLDKRITEVIDAVGLRARLHDRVGTFSRGMQQRLSIARAILHDPPIMFLDEPETGLDQEALAMLSGLLKTLIAGKRTVLMTTHRFEWGSELADRIVILHSGKIVFDEPGRGMELSTLRESYRRLTGAGS
ncbi:MAG: heme ABC exporter ATP-binding protein CcmA [Chloroflexi bacterium]|nr:heme ABC exporter ATP-binding protein CcmA [Chloroflexota bacterium]